MPNQLKILCLILILSTFPSFAQNSESLSVVISDQNADLVTVGVVSLADTKGNKLFEIDLSKSKQLTVNIGAGNYVLEIQSPGFKPYKKEIEIKKGQNIFQARLALEEFQVSIEVEQNERERRLDEVFGGYLSQKEIDSLPENGEDIKEELKNRYGDDILIRVDGGFEGSQVPSRAEISSIKVIRNAFDAEFHEVGRTIVDIRTNTITSKFYGFGSYTFNNSSLNARNPFALERQPQRTNNLLMFLTGPLIKKKTSFNFSTFGTDRTTTQNFIGIGFSGNAEPQQIGSRLAFTTFGIKHNLPKNHTLNLKYQNNTIKFTNIGLGAFDLPERGSTRKNIQHRFTLTESGTFKNKYANDFTLEFSAGSENVIPNSLERTIIILNAFNSGSFGSNSRTNRQKFRMTDNLIFDAKKHSLKIGGEIEYERLQTESESNLNGTYTFLTLTDFNNQRPSQFTQTLGKIEYQLNQLRASLYFQDYFKVNKALQLSLGLRYERQNDVSDGNNFSPRFGYVWSPEKSGKFIVRGGFGVFYNWLDTGILSAILSNDGRQGQRLIIRNPSFPNPFSGGQSEILPFSISKLADDLSTPYISVVQNGFNYKFDKALTFEGIHTFRRGLHNFRSRNINAPVNGVRPNADFGVIQLLESSGITQEQSFELKINGYYKGVNLFANYELSKLTDDFSSPLSLPMDNYNLRLERGLSNLDQRHKFNFTFNFNLFKKINISPSFKLESGFPYTITTGMDNNGDTVFNDRPQAIARNSERGEFLKQVDIRARWKMPIRYIGLKENKRKSLSLNVNVRNLLNTANLTNYVGIQTSPFFNKATTAHPPRSIDLGLSFFF